LKPLPVAALEETKPPVFKGARAKKLFKVFDSDRDKFLTRAEFAAGLVHFITAPELPPITQEQIDALWAETDVNKDDKISWNEFAHRFCGAPHPSTLGKKVEKKASLMLQTPRKKDPPAGKAGAAMAELRGILEALYDGSSSKPRYPGVDLSKSRVLPPPAFKKLLNSTLAEEKAEAKAQKRPLEEWAAKALASGAAADQKACDRLFNQLDERKTGKVDLGPFFEQLKLRPSTKPTASSSPKRGRSKVRDQNKPTGPSAYVLTTVKSEHVRDFVSEVILRHFPLNVSHSVKMHPPLKHWGDDERKRKALNTEGYKTTIFLSEKTKIKAVVKLPLPEADAASAAAAAAAKQPLSPKSPATKSPSATSRAGARSAGATSASAAAASSAAAAQPVNNSDVLIFASFRTEFTSMARCESLWHARLTLDADEQVRKVDVVEKKNWVDGELDKCMMEPCFPEWSTYVLTSQEDEFEEMSTPPIG